MSSGTVRRAFLDNWATYAPPGLDLVEVINEQVDPQELQEKLVDGGDGFAAIVFDLETRRDQTLGSNAWVVEVGTATIRVFYPSAEGDLRTVDACDALVSALAGRRLAAGVLVTAAEGPAEEDPDGEGLAYWLAVRCRYEAQTRAPRLQ